MLDQRIGYMDKGLMFKRANIGRKYELQSGEDFSFSRVNL